LKALDLLTESSFEVISNGSAAQTQAKQVSASRIEALDSMVENFEEVCNFRSLFCTCYITYPITNFDEKKIGARR